MRFPHITLTAALVHQAFMMKKFQFHQAEVNDFRSILPPFGSSHKLTTFCSASYFGISLPASANQFSLIGIGALAGSFMLHALADTILYFIQAGDPCGYIVRL